MSCKKNNSRGRKRKHLQVFCLIPTRQRGNRAAHGSWHLCQEPVVNTVVGNPRWLRITWNNKKKNPILPVRSTSRRTWVLSPGHFNILFLRRAAAVGPSGSSCSCSCSPGSQSPGVFILCNGLRSPTEHPPRLGGPAPPLVTSGLNDGCHVLRRLVTSG